MFTDKAIDYISWTLLIISIFLLGVAGKSMDNIIEGKKFILEYIIIGLIIASAWMYILYSLRRDYFKGDKTRASAVLGQFFSIPILTLFISGYYNYQTGKDNVYIKKGLVVNKFINIKYHTRYAIIKIDNIEERFNPSVSEWNKMIVGDTVLLMVGKGALKHEHIYQFLGDTLYNKTDIASPRPLPPEDTRFWPTIIKLSQNDDTAFFLTDSIYIPIQKLDSTNCEAYYRKVRKLIPREEIEIHRILWNIPEIREYQQGHGGDYTRVTWIISRPTKSDPYYLVEFRTCYPDGGIRIVINAGRFQVHKETHAVEISDLRDGKYYSLEYYQKNKGRFPGEK